MRILAIDPGPRLSALVWYDSERRMPFDHMHLENSEALNHVRKQNRDSCDLLAVEMIASYGMAVGAEVFNTCVIIGRFIEAGRSLQQRLVFRREVKLHMCDSPRANDSTIRQALIDRYGGKQEAIGLKRSPGPLYGFKGDDWAALGVAMTAAETERIS